MIGIDCLAIAVLSMVGFITSLVYIYRGGAKIFGIFEDVSFHGKWINNVEEDVKLINKSLKEQVRPGDIQNISYRLYELETKFHELSSKNKGK